MKVLQILRACKLRHSPIHDPLAALKPQPPDLCNVFYTGESSVVDARVAEPQLFQLGEIMKTCESHGVELRTIEFETAQILQVLQDRVDSFGVVAAPNPQLDNSSRVETDTEPITCRRSATACRSWRGVSPSRHCLARW